MNLPDVVVGDARRSLETGPGPETERSGQSTAGSESSRKGWKVGSYQCGRRLSKWAAKARASCILAMYRPGPDGVAGSGAGRYNGLSAGSSTRREDPDSAMTPCDPPEGSICRHWSAPRIPLAVRTVLICCGLGATNLFRILRSASIRFLSPMAIPRRRVSWMAMSGFYPAVPSSNFFASALSSSDTMRLALETSTRAQPPRHHVLVRFGILTVF